MKTCISKKHVIRESRIESGAGAGIRLFQYILSASGGQNIYKPLKRLDSGFRRNDEFYGTSTFYEFIIIRSFH
ncbi:MAG: hypothetical protein A2Z51_10520 [Deltaproteobacteria bacterium RBG_19FT_COMBO_52_11]|nr:MAG: hypothetical protein A2Z51_10520 [Deltaproteobacteria bacterium RBG_19FT_COMBO_52_11]